jgi:peptide chain release factor 1
MFDDPKFIAKLELLERRYAEVCDQLGQPEVIARRAEFMKLSKEQKHLGELTEFNTRRKKLAVELEEARAMLRGNDAELRELAKDEAPRLEDELAAVEQRVKLLLLPKDPRDDKNILLELRAGTGGDEAALFAGDLFRMYSRYAERKRWKFEVLSSSPGASGGLEEISVLI